jgi:hypothetical protein
MNYYTLHLNPPREKKIGAHHSPGRKILELLIPPVKQFRDFIKYSSFPPVEQFWDFIDDVETPSQSSQESEDSDDDSISRGKE